MFATVNPSTLSAPGIGGHGYSAKSFAMQIPKGFRIFKAPTMTSFPYASATAKFDVGYRPSTFSTGGDARLNPAWTSQRQDVDVRMFSSGFYNHIQPSIATASLSSNMRTYDTRSGNTLPYYPIYQDPTKDTYIYERSDTYSEIDTPSVAPSAFSPALSTDSTTSVKSSELPDRSISRSSQRAAGPAGGSGPSNPSAIQRQSSSSATSTSNALSIVRVASSRGSSQPESTINDSHSSAPPANERPRTPNYLSQPPVRPTGQPLANQYTNGFHAAPQMARVQSNSWKDYVEESILDQSSETARLNATLNARASARASMLYAQDELPEDHTDYQSIPQVPLPPDDVGQYAPVMSSSPDSYFPHVADPGSRRTSPVSPSQPNPRQQPRRTSPQQTHVSPTGPLVPYQPSTDRLSQEDEPFIPPLSYDNAASYITADPGIRASAASLPGGVQYSRNLAPSTSSVSSGSSNGNGRMSSFPAQPPVPVVQMGSNAFSQNDQQRYSQNLTPGYNNNVQSTVRPEQERPLPVPPTVAPVPERGFAFPQSASSSHRSRSRTPSVSPPPIVLPEGGRVRKDSIAVETVRLMKKKERPPSTSPPLDEQSRRRPGPGSNPAMPLSTNLSQAAASAAGVVSQQLPVRSPTNPPPTWPSNGVSFQVTGLPPSTAQPTSDASTRQMANTVIPTGTPASRRPLPGPRRMNSDPVPPSVPRIPPPPRRNTGGEQLLQPDADKCVLARLRVRWNETLICPSPIKPGDRRKGWFNRRGDQLWTNDGSYKPASPGEEYPVDLDSYPEYGIGWMNESGIRIDMEHRLIPKAPLRSALKQTQPQV